MTKGRGFGDWKKGREITSLADIHPGLVILAHSNQFDADNTLRVDNCKDQRFYAQYMDAGVGRPHGSTDVLLGVRATESSDVDSVCAMTTHLLHSAIEHLLWLLTPKGMAL